MFKGQTILVTGGAGSIGANVIRRLLSDNAEKIIIIDNLTSGREEFLPDDARIVFERSDIADTARMLKLLGDTEPNYIFHLAANFANQNSIEHPYLDIQSNIIGTLNLLEGARRLHSLRKFIYTSSSCVYGTQEEMAETNYVYPYETPYAINKYAAELYVKHHADLYGLPTLSVRLFNSYGPYELAGKYRNVIPNFIALALEGKPLTITGTGMETRDFVYVEDSVELLCLMALSDVGDGSFYNSGSGRETTIEELAQEIIRLSDSSSELSFIPRRDWDKVSKRVSDTTKTRTTFGFKPSFTLQEGLKRTIEWTKTVQDNIAL